MRRWFLVLLVPLLALSVAIPVSGKSLSALQGASLAASPAISVSPSTAKPGESITVTGSGFAPHDGQAVVRVSINGTTLNGNGAPVSASGTFSATVRIPQSTAAGSTTVLAQGFAPQGPQAASTPTPTPQPPATEAPTGTVAPVTATSTLTSVPPTATTTVPTLTPTLVPPTPPPPPTAAAPATPTTTPVPATPTATPSVLVYQPTVTVPPTAVQVIPTVTPTPTVIVQSVPITPTITQAPPQLTCTTIGSSGGPGPTIMCCPPQPSESGCICISGGEKFICFPNGVGTLDGGLTNRPSAVGPGRQSSSLIYHMEAGNAPAGAGSLVFDGDQASATLSVTAPSTPFSVSQAANCPTVPTAGVTSSCTIVETVVNTGNTTLDFSHTVVNHLAAGVTATSASASVGSIAISGSTVVWNNFQLAPHASASANIQVSFTPSASQIGSQVLLSDGISADAIDTTTGQRYLASASSLATPSRVVSGSTTPRRASGRGGSGAASTTQTRTTSANGNGLNGLPTTGGAALLSKKGVFRQQTSG